MEGKEIKKKIDRLWKLGKKDLDKMLNETTRLVKEGEAHIKDVSKQAEKKLETMVLSLERKKLNYELGKSLAILSKKKWVNSKKLGNLLEQIKGINRKIKGLGN